MSTNKGSTSSSPESVTSEGDKLHRLISQLSEKPANMKGNEGFFISQKKMNSLEERINKLMISGETSKTPSELISLNETLANVRQALQDSQDKLRASQQEAIDKSKEVMTLKSSIKSLESATELAKKEHANERSELLVQLNDLKTKAGPLKIAAAAAKRGGDPEDALAKDQERAANAANITALQNKLNALQQSDMQLNDQLTAARAKIIKLEAEQIAVLKANKTLEESLYQKADSDSGPIEPRSVELNSVILKQLIGDKGIDFLVRADLAVRTDIRERSYQLMQAAKKANTEAIKGYGAIFEVLFQWVRRMTWKAANKVRSWLDEIEADFRRATLKPIAYYRKSLELLIEEKISVVKSSNERRKKNSQSEYTDSTFNNLWFYGYAIIRRIKRNVKSNKSKFSRWVSHKWNAFTAGFSKFYLLWTSSEVNSREASEIKMVDEEEELLAGTGFNTVPVRRPNKKGKSIHFS